MMLFLVLLYSLVNTYNILSIFIGKKWNSLFIWISLVISESKCFIKVFLVTCVYFLCCLIMLFAHFLMRDVILINYYIKKSFFGFLLLFLAGYSCGYGCVVYFFPSFPKFILPSLSWWFALAMISRTVNNNKTKDHQTLHLRRKYLGFYSLI